MVFNLFLFSHTHTTHNTVNVKKGTNHMKWISSLRWPSSHPPKQVLRTRFQCHWCSWHVCARHIVASRTMHSCPLAVRWHDDLAVVAVASVRPGRRIQRDMVASDVAMWRVERSKEVVAELLTRPLHIHSIGYCMMALEMLMCPSVCCRLHASIWTMLMYWIEIRSAMIPVRKLNKIFCFRCKLNGFINAIENNISKQKNRKPMRDNKNVFSTLTWEPRHPLNALYCDGRA